MKRDRQEHRHDGDGRGDDRQADLVGALHRRRDTAACPCCTRFSMFSISTMASSTRMPITRVSASRVTMLRLKPNKP